MLNLVRLVLLAVLIPGDGLVWAKDGHHRRPDPVREPTGPASTAQSFGTVVARAMERMHAAMAAVPRTGQPDRDFLTAMVPHHQAAIDMAKAVLLVTTDPRIRNLAQSILTEQQYEIDLMTRLLAEMPSPSSPMKEKAP